MRGAQAGSVSALDSPGTALSSPKITEVLGPVPLTFSDGTLHATAALPLGTARGGAAGRR
ncbi:hypothetical protein GCM10018966_077140 [Streptomyces yanii]